MRFEVDSYFSIGRSHVQQCLPCQDYALSGVGPDSAYAIVSDGCSSGGKTDIGSRLTGLIANVILNTTHQDSETNWIDFGFDNLHDQLDTFKRLLRLQDIDMLATCLAVAIKKISITCKVMGDGVIGVIYRDGSMRFERIEWSNNTPFYPIYQLDMSRFNAAHNNNPLPLSRHIVMISDGQAEHHYENYPIDASISYEFGPVHDIEYIGVFSDGVCQIDGQEWIDAMISLMAYPTSKGVFLKRRMSSIIRESQKSGKGPIDDIAGSVIHIILDN